jgi:hypothetical protein
MTKKKPGGGDRFERQTVVSSSANPGQAAEWLAVFVDRFVMKAKRVRARELLNRQERRLEGLRDLWSWISVESAEELSGSAGFPQHIEPLLGGSPGIYFGFDGRELVVSAGHAAMLASSDGLSALFLLDGGRTALLFAEVGPPLLLR